MPMHHSVSFHLTSNSRDTNPVINPRPCSQSNSGIYNRVSNPAPRFEDRVYHGLGLYDGSEHATVSAVGHAMVRYDKHGCPLPPREIGYQAPIWDKKRVYGLPTNDVLVMRGVEQVPDWYRRKAGRPVDQFSDEKVRKKKSGLGERFRKLFACFKIAT